MPRIAISNTIYFDKWLVAGILYSSLYAVITMLFHACLNIQEFFLAVGRGEFRGGREGRVGGLFK
jgi:hypothetical protein